MHLFVLQGELPETFFQVLVESLKVEALIGLRDALEPESLVPVPGPTSAPPAEALPQDASGTAAESSQDTEDTSSPAGIVHIRSLAAHLFLGRGMAFSTHEGSRWRLCICEAGQPDGRCRPYHGVDSR